jgi:hypothetical protein
LSEALSGAIHDNKRIAIYYNLFLGYTDTPISMTAYGPAAASICG